MKWPHDNISFRNAMKSIENIRLYTIAIATRQNDRLKLYLAMDVANCPKVNAHTQVCAHLFESERWLTDCC
jgi:hypothetical protein